MQRYLIQFSYLGTRFRGVQLQGVRFQDFRTVQGVLETGLMFLKPANDPVTHLSSRTDTGVHALNNALHVDLMPPGGKEPFDPDFITHHLNVFFAKAEVSIRVQRTRLVSEAFNARHHACRRHYLYRIATLSDPRLLSSGPECGHNFMPVAELNRLYVVRRPVDVELLREGCALMQREADFASFMHVPLKGKETPDTLKNLEKVELRDGQPLMNPLYDPAYDYLRLWDVVFTSKSFLRNQIRRCMSAIVGLSVGAITKDDIEQMFANPHPSNKPAGVNLAPGCGLYLLKVDYPDHVLDPNFVPEDLTEDQKRWQHNATAISTAVALRQTSILSDPPTPVEVLVEKFSEVPRESSHLNGAEKFVRTVESERVTKDAEYSGLESESSVHSVTRSQNSTTDGKFSNQGDNTDPLSDTAVSHPREKNVLYMALDKVDAEDSSAIHVGNCESKGEMPSAGETLDASYEDSEGSTGKHDSSPSCPNGRSVSKRRRLILEAYDLLEAREKLDKRLKILLEQLVDASLKERERDFSEEGMEQVAAEIRQLMIQNQDEKVFLAFGTMVKPIKPNREIQASG